AARRPASRPWYSATLLVVVASAAACSASTSPVSASRTTAPYPAGPGLPREPPSASTTNRRPAPPAPRWPALTRSPRRRSRDSTLVRSHARSQAGLGRAHQDPAALLA